MSAVAEAQSLQQQLYGSQNPDGGWGFHRGDSWTEPTALATLALTAQADGINEEVNARGFGWLLRTQRRDGAWAPQPGVDISTWVTSVATLALMNGDQRATIPSALNWLCGQVKGPDTPVQRFLRRWQTSSITPEATAGSSWFPGTAAWLYPTALAVITFSNAARLMNDRDLATLAERGRAFILARRCRDGGWNHGGSRFLSEDAPSYPEMTGVALLALDGISFDELRYPLQRAAAFLKCPNSSEGLSWLQMAEVKHGQPITEFRGSLPCRTTRDVALRLLALTASSPRNLLVQPHS